MKEDIGGQGRHRSVVQDLGFMGNVLLDVFVLLQMPRDLANGKTIGQAYGRGFKNNSCR